MTAAQKGMIAIGLTVLSGVLAIHGYNLMETLEVRDGAGTGVYFLFFEINDRVPWSDVAGYANGFWTASLIVFVTAVLLVKGVKVNNLFLGEKKS